MCQYRQLCALEGDYPLHLRTRDIQKGSIFNPGDIQKQNDPKQEGDLKSLSYLYK
jgi:hypothetical protein